MMETTSGKLTSLAERKTWGRPKGRIKVALSYDAHGCRTPEKAQVTCMITPMDLCKTDISVCAFESGFNSICTFHRVFYAEFGCTLKEYMNRMKI